MTPERKGELIPDYTAGRTSRRELQEQGFADDIQVLDGRGELRFRLRIAPMGGPSLAARERGREILRRRLNGGPRLQRR